jgi:MFS superfamily sulfate permease-like transporter
MNIQLLQWGLFSFVLGLILSLPLAAVHYQKSPQWTKIFTNPRKLKSAHLDFFTQAFAAAFVYVLEWALKKQFPEYVVIPLVFGTICNPLILLIEATPIYRSGFGAIIYKLLRATSPASLLFAWFFISWNVLPAYLILMLPVVVLLGFMLIVNYNRLHKE